MAKTGTERVTAYRARRKARFEALEERFVKGTILRICPADESGKQEIKLILDADAQEVGAELAGMFGKNVDEFMEEQLKLNIAKLPKRKQEPRSPDVQGAFDRMKITLSVIPSTATTKPRLNVAYDFDTLEDRALCEAYAAAGLVDLASLLDDNFRMAAARNLKGPLGETETWDGGEIEGRIMWKDEGK